MKKPSYRAAIRWIADNDATHSNGNSLRLSDLLTADDANFGHDVLGIRRHINRETGQLENCFSPRFSMRVVRAAHG